MIITERISRDLKVEYDTEIPRIAFYYQGDEIESTTIEPFMTKMIAFMDFMKLYELSKQVKQ